MNSEHYPPLYTQRLGLSMLCTLGREGHFLAKAVYRTKRERSSFFHLKNKLIRSFACASEGIDRTDVQESRVDKSLGFPLVSAPSARGTVHEKNLIHLRLASVSTLSRARR